ncbi:MAG: tRNA lysidine(34) synthetase TilS [Oligoflexales bacterium]
MSQKEISHSSNSLFELKIKTSFQHIAIACSGGADSISLAHRILKLQHNEHIKKICILHVNYQLRGLESDEDEDFIKDFAFQNKVEAHILKASPPPKSNIQAWARAVRRQWFQEWAQQGWVIALAHHRNDIAENTLLRLSRGTSAGHMAGLRTYSPPYWRPLLKLSKQDLLSYLQLHQQNYREDSSNQKDDYTRNVIRHQILPKLEKMHPGASKRIARTAQQAQEICDWVRAPYKGRTSIHVDEIRSAPPSVAREIISAIVSPQEQWLSEKILDQMHAALLKNKQSCWTRPDQKRCIIKNKTLTLL